MTMMRQLVCGGLILLAGWNGAFTGRAQTSAFTYQGRLLENEHPANGVYDFRFALFAHPAIRDPYTDYLTNSAVPVADGLFSVVLDFGPEAFNRSSAWLEIGVRTNSNLPRPPAFLQQGPRQRLTAVPWAMRAGGLPAGAVTETELADGAVTALKLGPGAITAGNIAAGTIVNADISASAAIADTKLATLSTAGKVANSATTATSANTGNTIVARDAAGSFSANTITAAAATLQASGVANHDNLRIKKTGVPASTNVQFVLSHRSDGTALWLYGYDGTTYRNVQGWDYGNNSVRFPANGQDLFINEGLGRVGVGTASPQQRLHVTGNTRVDGSGAGTANPALYVTNATTTGIGIFSVTSSSDANLVVVNKASGDILKAFSGATGGNLVFQVGNAGQVYCGDELSCQSLMIRGGADLAEPFAMADDAVPAGAVVVIDPLQPGRLRLSTQAYDSKVAGIVSGAGGVQPGISMIQTEVLEGGRNVALSGRVYALVDAGIAPVAPGDLLTTSATPGHAMKAADPARRSGAILGKAMTSLEAGRGLVLVLVSLQ